MRWTLLLGLVVCNAIWASNPITGKVLLRTFEPLQVAHLRYGASALMMLLLAAVLHFRRPRALTPLPVVFRWENFHWLVWLGLMTFFGSAVLQYLGLTRSTAMANSLIVAIEPLIAVFLAWVFLREALTAIQWTAIGLALAGFLLLSNVKPHSFAESLGIFNVGNLFFLAVMPLEAMHTIISRRLAGRVTPISLMATSLAIGWLALTGYVAISDAGFADLSRLDWRNCLSLFLIGPIGTALTYAYWSLALVNAPVAAVTLTLFVQPILGAVAGFVLLGEKLDWWQSAGGLLILFALSLQSQQGLRRRKA